MSDLINGLGARGAAAYGLGATRPTGAAAGAAPAGAANETAGAPAAGGVENFAPTAEAGESKQDTRAGEAAASAFASVWASGAASANAGQLQVQGAENTTVNQVHGVQNGQHVGSGGPEAGFSAATVYSSKPPA